MPLIRTLKLAAIGAAALAAGLGPASAEPGPKPAAKPCTDLGRSCVLEVAWTYVQNIADGEHPDARVRFAQKVKRVENAVLHMVEAPALPAPGSPPRQSQYKWTARDHRVWIDGGNAFFRYELDMQNLATGEPASTSHIFERIRVEKGHACAYGNPEPCITEVELLFCNAPHAAEEGFPSTGLRDRNYVCERKG